jgi:hypothetical protein
MQVFVTGAEKGFDVGTDLNTLLHSEKCSQFCVFPRAQLRRFVALIRCLKIGQGTAEE